MFVGVWVPRLNCNPRVLTMRWLPSVITALSEDAGAAPACENCELVLLPCPAKWQIHLHHARWWRILLLLNSAGLGSRELSHNFFYILTEALHLLPKSFSSTEESPPAFCSGLTGVWRTLLLENTLAARAPSDGRQRAEGRTQQGAEDLPHGAPADSLRARERPHFGAEVSTHTPDGVNIHACRAERPTRFHPDEGWDLAS